MRLGYTFNASSSLYHFVEIPEKIPVQVFVEIPNWQDRRPLRFTNIGRLLLLILIVIYHYTAQTYFNIIYSCISEPTQDKQAALSTFSLSAFLFFQPVSEITLSVYQKVWCFRRSTCKFAEGCDQPTVVTMHPSALHSQLQTARVLLEFLPSRSTSF